MATISATHGAAAIKQITTLAVAGTWANGDTLQLTINGKDLVVTIGDDTSTTQVATSILEAWQATARLNSDDGSTDATSNFGGAEFGEFLEAIARIDPDTQSTVILTGKDAGVPFTVTSSVTTAGDGDITLTNAVAATGPWHWDNGDNWSGGSAPADDDVVVLKDQSGTNVGFKYGLPNGSREVTIQHWMSYTGQIGLPPINASNGSKPYPEYRQRYVRLDDAGTGTDIAHRFGLGKDGTGSPLINLKHSTVKCSPVIYNTGTPQISGLKALNICCTANTSTLNIINGSVDWGSQDGGTSAFLVMSQLAGDSRGVNGMHTASAQLVLQGGTVTAGGTGAISNIKVRGGSLRLENQTGTITGLLIYPGGFVDWASTGTISAIESYGGSFDARNSPGFSVGDVKLYRGSKFFEPLGIMIVVNDAYIYFDPTPDLVFGASEGDSRIKVV